MHTFSTRERCRTISPYTQGIGVNLPGQSVFSWGHANHVASCLSHSAGIRSPADVTSSCRDILNRASVARWANKRLCACPEGRASSYEPRPYPSDRIPLLVLPIPLPNLARSLDRRDLR